MERTGVDSRVRPSLSSERGISLIETMIAAGVLTMGTLAMGGLFVRGMQVAVSAPNELVATQKAAEAVESVFSARDSRTIAWTQLRNVDDGGIFLNGPQPMRVAGPDGLLNTADDGLVEAAQYTGKDQVHGTADDVTSTLGRYRREVKVTDITDELRMITVTVTYPAGAGTQTFTLTSYISAFA